MIDENFRRLFIATHLLYPNSAQARDIVFQISTQLRAKIDKSQPKEQLGIYFSALVQIYRRVSTIKSGFKFFEFKDQKLNDWKNILKKCNTNEILIFLGIAVLKIEISDIARILKFSPNQVRYLFGLAIRKAVASQESANDGFQQPHVVAFKFRHYKDSDVTYSNLLEKVVDFVFLSALSSKRSTFEHFSRDNEIHISERNQGNIGFLFGKISALYAELSNIEIDEPFLVEFQKEAKSFAQKSRLKIRLEWRWVGVISVITISVLMFFLRPDFRASGCLYSAVELSRGDSDRCGDGTGARRKHDRGETRVEHSDQTLATAAGIGVEDRASAQLEQDVRTVVRGDQAVDVGQHPTIASPPRVV